MRGLDAVLFDYGHTLIYFDDRQTPALRSALVETYQQINHLLTSRLAREVPSAQALLEGVSTQVDAEITRDYEAERLEEVEIASIYDAALRRLGLEVDPELVEQVMEMEQDAWLAGVHVGPDVVSTMERVRAAGLKVGLVSNAAYLPRLMRAQLDHLRLAEYFDSVTWSSAVGWRKPERRIYQQALEALQVSPERAIFVGDRVREDVRGPKALGMRAVLLREWRQEKDPEGAADYTLDRLGQLGPLLDTLASG
ncbi:MAG TPA: HAD-IA family hydrolase [Candidatus Limnocylindria bacterium]|nr:HAD-IA family hydrolase [Candidatus Limnocylindria bacterium]